MKDSYDFGIGAYAPSAILRAPCCPRPPRSVWGDCCGSHFSFKGAQRTHLVDAIHNAQRNSAIYCQRGFENEHSKRRSAELGKSGHPKA